MFKYGGLEIVTVGDILKDEFLEPLGISQYRLAKEICVSHTLITKIIKGKTAVTADTALRFSQFFGTTPEFWLNLQFSQDLKIAKTKQKEQHIKIKCFSEAAIA